MYNKFKLIIPFVLFLSGAIEGAEAYLGRI